MFAAVTAEKPVGGPFTGGTEFIQNFHKGEIYLIGENFVGKKFSLGKFLLPSEYFVTFSQQKVFLRYNEFGLS